MAALCSISLPTHPLTYMAISMKKYFRQSTKWCSVYREPNPPGSYAHVSSIRVMCNGSEPTVIERDGTQMSPLNVDSEIEVYSEIPEFGSADDVKVALNKSLQGLNRGIFGVPADRKTEIERLLKLLEAQNPNPRPTESLQMVNGQWRLLYSTISILGSKRTKLGLREFITLGEFVQTIDVKKGKAENTIGFVVSGLGMLTGELTVEASFKITGPKRVDIQYEKSALVPQKLHNLFRMNYDLLLSIFNPEGWLDITYVDNTTRIGRDDKGNVFFLERIAQIGIQGERS